MPRICRHALSADIECTRMLGKKRSFYATLLDGAQSRLKRCEARAAEEHTREFYFKPVVMTVEVGMQCGRRVLKHSAGCRSVLCIVSTWAIEAHKRLYAESR